MVTLHKPFGTSKFPSATWELGKTRQEYWHTGMSVLMLTVICYVVQARMTSAIRSISCSGKLDHEAYVIVGQRGFIWCMFDKVLLLWLARSFGCLTKQKIWVDLFSSLASLLQTKHLQNVCLQKFNLTSGRYRWKEIKKLKRRGTSFSCPIVLSK